MTQVGDSQSVERAGQGWQPGSDVVDHSGENIPTDADFFAPPPEIGEVLTARTSLKRDVKPKSFPTRLGIALMVAGAIMLVMMLVRPSLPGRDKALAQLMLVVFLLLAEEGNPGPHIEALAQIATLFQVPGFIERLIAAESSAELHRMIAVEEERED